MLSSQLLHAKYRSIVLNDRMRMDNVNCGHPYQVERFDAKDLIIYLLIEIDNAFHCLKSSLEPSLRNQFPSYPVFFQSRKEIMRFQ